MRLRRAPLLLLVACLLGLGACGGGGDGEQQTFADPSPSGSTGATGSTAPAGTGATGTTSTAPAPAPAPVTTTTQTTPSAEPTGPGRPGPGDEEPIRQPVAFKVGGDDVTPSSVSVSPFLAIELRIENVGATPLTVRLLGTDTTIELAPGTTGTRRLKGLRTGLYTLSVNDGAQVATVVVGDDVGP